MPQSIFKVLLSLAMLGVAHLLAQACSRIPWVSGASSMIYSYIAAYAVELLVVMLSWWLIWRHDVRWTGTRILLTVAAGAVPLAGLLGLAVYQLHAGRFAFAFSQLALAVARLVQGPLPLLLVLIWRQTAGERGQFFARQGAKP